MLLACGVIGPILFIVVGFVAGAVRPGYSAWHTYVSMLSLGEGGWVQVANFFVTGALLIAFAVGLRRRGNLWPAILVGVIGAGLGLQGVFAADPGLGYPAGAPDGVPSTQSPGSALHYLLGFVAALALVGTAVLIARRFRKDSRLAGWARYSTVTAALSFALFVAVAIAGSDGPTLQGLAGAIQRLWILVGFTWLSLLALRFLREGADNAQ
jgi:hypothetical membrane protein